MRKKIGSLNCLVREGDDPRDVVILLHGFGADANDLFSLCDLVDPTARWTFVLPNAPLEVPLGHGFQGRAWFPISIASLEAGIDFTTLKPPGLDAAAQAVGDLIFELNPKRLVLGGFSQGAMLGTEVALRSPAEISALVLLSATLLDRERWTKLAVGLKNKNVLQSHGTHDGVLPFVAARALHSMLKDAGASVDFVEFGGAHEIPGPVLLKFTRLLKELHGQT